MKTTGFVAEEVKAEGILHCRALFILPAYTSLARHIISNLVWRHPVSNEASRVPHTVTHLATEVQVTRPANNYTISRPEQRLTLPTFRACAFELPQILRHE
jgi:hypothetical protein